MLLLDICTLIFECKNNLRSISMFYKIKQTNYLLLFLLVCTSCAPWDLDHSQGWKFHLITNLIFCIWETSLYLIVSCWRCSFKNYNGSTVIWDLRRSESTLTTWLNGGSTVKTVKWKSVLTFLHALLFFIKGAIGLSNKPKMLDPHKS